MRVVAFYRIVGDDLPRAEDLLDEALLDDPVLQDWAANLPNITAEGDLLVSFVARTAYLRVEIPERLELNDCLEIADRLDCDCFPQLLDRIGAVDGRTLLDAGARERFADTHFREYVPGVQRAGRMSAGLYVRLVGVHAGYTLLRLTEPAASSSTVARMQHGRLFFGAERGDSCAICLDPARPGAWATARGCSQHRFHTDCIVQWQQPNCPLCRARLW